MFEPIEDPADLFCRTVRELDPRALTDHSDAWFADDDFLEECQEIAAAVEAGVAIGDVVEPADSIAGQRERAALLRGVDLAFATLNPFTGAGVVPDALVSHMHRLELHGRFNSHTEDGLLLPRLAWTTDARDFQPFVVRELFQQLVYVRHDTRRRARLALAPMRARMSREQRAAHLTVACAPGVSDAAELRLSAERRGGEEWYHGELADTPAARARIDQIFRRLIADDVHLGLLPELSCSVGLLEHWCDVVASDCGEVRWLLVGTGNISNGAEARVNAAVLLDAGTGEQLLVQQKIFPFDIPVADQAKLYPLGIGTGRRILREDIKVGYDLNILDIGAARVAILICEDLTRTTDLVTELVECGVSHVLTPIFSRPCTPRRWADNAAAVAIKETGATVLVANSMVVGRLVEQAEGRPPDPDGLYTAIAVTASGTTSQRRSAPDQLARFTLRNGDKPIALDDAAPPPERR